MYQEPPRGFLSCRLRSALTRLPRLHFYPKAGCRYRTQRPLYHPSKFLCEIRMLGRRRRRVRRHIGYVPLFKFHQLGDHSEARLQVGDTRIVFVSELLYHSFKMHISSFDPILSQIGTF